jgi:hypothetical protein
MIQQLRPVHLIITYNYHDILNLLHFEFSSNYCKNYFNRYTLDFANKEFAEIRFLSH